MSRLKAVQGRSKKEPELAATLCSGPAAHLKISSVLSLATSDTEMKLAV